MSIDQERYRMAREKIVGETRRPEGIGTLSEKTVHAVMKNYYEPDENKQEIPVFRLVADIFTGKEIMEVQTRNFYPLKKKLETFLLSYPVTIVYPLPYRKWVIWIDEETGELSERRKSPKIGNAYDAFKELYKIKDFLTHERLTIKLAFLNMEEYRLLNGWSRDKKRGSHRYDRIPLEFIEEQEFATPEDFLRLIPKGMEEPFGTKDFAQAAKIRQALAGQVVHILYRLNQIERLGKKGNSYLYRVKKTGK